MAIAVAALGFAELDGSMAGIFLALPLVMLIGLWDDRRGMAPKVKLALLVAVTLIPVAAYGLTFERVTLPCWATATWAGSPTRSPSCGSCWWPIS